jgi:hypothetical protein
MWLAVDFFFLVMMETFRSYRLVIYEGEFTLGLGSGLT